MNDVIQSKWAKAARWLPILLAAAVFHSAWPGESLAQDSPPPTEQAQEQPQGDAGGQDAGAEEKDKEDVPKRPPVSLTNPRETMVAFLLAVEEATRDAPQRISDAVTCLDISALEGEDRDERAKRFARRLYMIVDKIGVTLDDVPEKPDGDEFVFYNVEPDPDQNGSQPPLAISLIRAPGSVEWRFSPATIESIPDLESHVKSLEQEKQAEDSDVPAQFQSPRSVMITFINAMSEDPPDTATAAGCFDPGDTKPDIWEPLSLELAVQLKNVMDKTRRVVATEIPDNLQAGDIYAWHTSDVGNIEIGAIGDGSLKGQWRFTTETASTLDALYQSLLDQPIIRELREAGVEEQLTLALRIKRLLPESYKRDFLSLEIWQWIAVAALLLLGWLIRVVVSAFTGLILNRYIRKRQKNIDIKAFQKVLIWAGYSANAGFWLIMVPRLAFPSGLFEYALPTLQFMFAFAITWLCYRLVDVVAGYIAADQGLRITQFDDLLLPLLRTVFRMLVIVLVILFVMEWVFEQPPSSVLGALGIGGVAIAFAAKDTLGNFFGSLTLLLDRPFGIGDWVVISGVEGTVEHVGFRSTRIRTFYNSRITVPNSALATSNVDNYGARKFRRASFNLALTYDTSAEKIEVFCEGIRELVRLHQYTRKDYYHVYFNKFDDSSLNILVYVFFTTPDWSTELREKHNFFLDILRLAKHVGVEFAFPTQTLWLQQPEPTDQASAAKPASDMAARHMAAAGTDATGKDGSDMEQVGVDAAAHIFRETYGTDAPRRTPVIIELTPRSHREPDEENTDTAENPGHPA
ncbi:MAG: mechanosensitive ion channel family protein [Planctomycetota bacterium]|jgi:MscS family membrane protein